MHFADRPRENFRVRIAFTLKFNGIRDRSPPLVTFDFQLLKLIFELAL
jgi:hypothetical protein